MLACSFLIKSSSEWLVTRTGIEAQMSLISGQKRPLILGVTCPWVMKISHFLTCISLKPTNQSLSNFICSITGVGERLHNVLRQIWSKLWCPWQQKAPTDLWENGVSTFSRLLLIRSFLYLQVTRTCIKSQGNSNFGKIGPLTTELAALERLNNFS